MKITPDYPEINSKEADYFLENANILALPGGARGAEALAKENRVHIQLRIFAVHDTESSDHIPGGRWVAAICAATTLLLDIMREGETWEGYERPRPRVTSHPSVKEEIVKAGWEYGGQDERVVVSGNVITSRGPGTALEWALAIVEVVAGFEKRMEVQGPMMVATVL